MTTEKVYVWGEEVTLSEFDLIEINRIFKTSIPSLQTIKLVFAIAKTHNKSNTPDYMNSVSERVREVLNMAASENLTVLDVCGKLFK